LSARAFRALAFVPLVLGCGERGSVDVGDACAPDAAAAPDTAAAPDGPTTTIQVNFTSGLVADMGAAFQMPDYTSSPHEIGGMMFYSEPTFDQVDVSSAVLVQLLPADNLAGQTMNFGGRREPTDPPLGVPGKGYAIARALYDLMKVPDRRDFGTLTRLSPSGRISCAVSNDDVPGATPSAGCSFTGIISTTIWCDNCP
jgi:hypothetical protein